MRRRISKTLNPDEAREALSWAQEHRAKPAFKPPPRIGIAAARLIKPLAHQFGPGASELEQNWAEIVGDALATWSKPVKISGGAAGYTLWIQARGPAAALIEAQSSRILDRVAQYTGRKPARLRVTQTAGTRSAKPVKVQKKVAVSDQPPLPNDPQERLRVLLERGRARMNDPN